METDRYRDIVSVGWDIYHLLKAESERMSSVEVRKKLAEYMTLDIEKPSLLHSLMLVFAENYFDGHRDFNFFHFFRLWNPEHFREEDWTRRKGNNGVTFKSLCEKALSTAFDSLKNTPMEKRGDVSWFYSFYQKAADRFSDNLWLKREFAMMAIWTGDKPKALSLYRTLSQEKGDLYFIWQEIASIIDDTDIRIGMYSKALLLKNDESFVGEIRLQMAGCLIEKGMLQEALTELELYRTHREAKGWKTDTSYFRMKEKIGSDVTCPKGDENLSLYRRYSHYADDFAYSNIEKLSYCVVRLFTNKNGTPLCILTDGHSTILTKVSRFKKCGKVDVGSIFHIRKSGDTIFSVERAECAPWQILPSAIFTVTNVNPVKCLFHLHGLPGDANVLFRDTPLRPSLGDRISANYYFSDKDGTKKMMIAHVTPAN